jgi:hypothetical protein
MHTLRHPSPKPPRQRARSHAPKTDPSPLLRSRFTPSQLLRRFHPLLPANLVASWLALSEKQFYQRAFTPLITLWYCVFQRLHSNHHLSNIVEDALAGGADRLSPPGLRLSQKLCSLATTSFSDARQRVPLDLFAKTLRHTAGHLASTLQAPLRFGLKVGLLDGTTIRLRPLGDIPKHFPPHRPGNCKKKPYWCLARIVGVFCAATGCAVDSVMDAIRTSEQALSAVLLKSSWEKWLLVADRNFGVYSVVRSAVAAHAHALFRLTEARADKLARSVGRKLRSGLDAPMAWQPSRHDQCPEGLTRIPVAGRLLARRVQRRGFRAMTLYLFTTLADPVEYPAPELARLYAERWNVELCFRYVKAQMELGFLECRSADMARKEWLAGLIAYNLIRWVMAAAAASARVPVQNLSFSRARELLLGWLVRSSGQRCRSKSWERLLTRVARARLPKRRKRRPSEPRAIRVFNKDVGKLEGSRAAARKKLAKLNAKS